MKTMIATLFAAFAVATFAAPAQAEAPAPNEAYQQHVIGDLARQAGVESASAQLRAMLGAEVEGRNLARAVRTAQGDQAGRLTLAAAAGKSREDSIETLVEKLFTGAEARDRAEARAHRVHEGSAMVTGDYEHSRREIYRALEAAH